jgi:hypothetical protein
MPWYDPLEDTPIEDRQDTPRCPRRGHGPMRGLNRTHRQGNWLHEYWYCCRDNCDETIHAGRLIGDGLRLPPENAEQTDDGDV